MPDFLNLESDMSNERFTQGEWVVGHQSDEVSVYMGDAVDSPYEYQCSDVWSCDSYWSEGDETAIANAHIISAAPKMYRALRDVENKIPFTPNVLGGEYMITLTQDEVDAIRAALAKADGEV